MGDRRILAGVVFILACGNVSAQWLKIKTPGIPRKADGKPDLKAPAPPPIAGKPDLTGLWSVEQSALWINIAGDSKPGDILPWADGVYKKRLDDLDRDTPATHCLPTGPTELVAGGQFRLMQAPNVIAILSEGGGYRQVFMDGRELPKDPNPTWGGYSVGHWEGNALVVESAGFNDKTWLDWGGHPHTESLKVTERFERRDFGHMSYQITLDDPKTFAKPLTLKLGVNYAADTEMLEYVCNENEADSRHLVGKASDSVKGHVTVSANALDALTGNYESNEPKMKAAMRVSNGELVFSIGDAKGGLALTPISETNFFMPGGFPVDFEKNGKGVATAFILHAAEGDMKFSRVQEGTH